MEEPKITRTEWAELQVEELLSVPFVSEFVFRSPKHHDPDEKEVIDHLIIHGAGASFFLRRRRRSPTSGQPSAMSYGC